MNLNNKDIIYLFKKYTNLETIENKHILFKTIILSIIIYFSLTYFFPNDYSSVIILIIFICGILYLYLLNISENSTSINEILMYKLNTLQDITDKYISTKIHDPTNPTNLNKQEIINIYKRNKLDSLYIDSNLIDFLFSIKILSEWNQPEFHKLLKGSNNILKLRKEIEDYYEANHKYPYNINEMFEDALFLRSNCINNMHNFIYKIPKQLKMYNYLNDIIERYQILLSRNTDYIYNYSRKHNKKTGINTKTKFQIYNTIKANDPYENDFYI